MWASFAAKPNSAVVSALAAAAMPSLKLAESSSTKHKEVVTGVDWSAANELLSVSDDKTVWLWNIDGEPQAQILTIDSFCTGLLWAPGGQGKADSFVVGCTDGSFKLVSRRGQIEKSVPAHQGAVTCVRWSHDNTSLATCGEDGVCAFDARVWREVAHFAGLAPLTALAFHGESKLFVGDADGRLYALDVWKAPPRSWE